MRCTFQGYIDLVAKASELDLIWCMKKAKRMSKTRFESDENAAQA